MQSSTTSALPQKQIAQADYLEPSPALCSFDWSSISEQMLLIQLDDVKLSLKY